MLASTAATPKVGGGLDEPFSLIDLTDFRLASFRFASLAHGKVATPVPEIEPVVSVRNPSSTLGRGRHRYNDRHGCCGFR